MFQWRPATSILLVLALAACGEANSAEEEGIPVEEATPPAPAVDAGTQVTLTLQVPLSTEDEIVGHPFSALVTENVTGSNGAVLIPAGSVVNGTVAEAAQSTGSEMTAFINLKPQSIVIGGKARPLQATVVQAEVEADAQDSKTETAAKVGVGAVAGAIAGRVIGGDAQGAAIGAGVGAAAGGAVAVTTRSGHAHMKEGALVMIRLDQRLVVP